LKKSRYNIGTPPGRRPVGLHSESVGKRLTLLRQKMCMADKSRFQRWAQARLHIVYYLP